MRGTASARGEGASVEAAKGAIESPLKEAGGGKGARGVLINITGSSRLSLHDVNEACSLIRAETAYEDVQINFGVVLNESMEDEVKITVIATGFQRDNLPQLVRRHVGAQSSALEPTAPSPVENETVYEPPMAAAPEPEPVFEEKINGQAPLNDLDMPAYLRRDRRLYQ